jgi:hypothetical protein
MATLTLDTQRNVLILAIKGEQPRTLRMKDSKASLYDLYKQARDLADVEPGLQPSLEVTDNGHPLYLSGPRPATATGVATQVWKCEVSA